MKIIERSRFVGNVTLINFLFDALKSERLPHAMIFSGLEGIGKFSVAMSLSASLFCDTPAEESFCGNCRQCRLIEAGTHPDLQIIQIEENHKEIGIDSIRNLIPIVHKKPFLARVKSVIIDQADLMTDEASNALLKILEEPPGNAYFFLITSKSASLLPTIRSRSQFFRFSAVSAGEIETFLLNRGYSSAEARLASHMSSGSIADVLKWDSKRFEETAKLMNMLMDLIEDGNFLSMTDIVRSLSAGRKEFDMIMGYCYSVFRDLLLIKTGCNPSLLINGSYKDKLESICSNISTEKIVGLLESFDRWLQANRKNLNLKMNSEDFAIQLAAIRK